MVDHSKNKTVSIEKCASEDVVCVGAFYDGVVKYLVEHVNFPRWMYKRYPSEPFVREMTVVGCQYVCRIDGQIVAAFALNDDPQHEYKKVSFSKSLLQGEYLVIHALAVATELQGRGIGKQIVRFCIDYACAHGYKAIRLDVVPTNYPAKKLYEQCGFAYLGDVDLERGFEDIPLFSMYELNL
ncbi:MAG: GNAT family N-acetyltransferase [Clostridiales bacterium]|nr:GNAT family N-acetyltransferase [Clostridiales bacterium]